jgi:glycosyltransferase involved in cell wall biosynthesis
MSIDSASCKSIPGISACMIVKNEEKLLATCLRSIQDYVDEIVVVDTGSTDRTVEIAESFGARIYHHPWEDHFSKHRNQSFGYAKYDWIFYIDADEELLTGSGAMLGNVMNAAADDVDAIAVTLECIYNEGRSMSYSNAVRIFRNHRGFYYKGRVHNYIVGVKKALCCPIRLFHHGYNLDKSSMSKKFERTTKLLKMDIADDPYDPRPHHFLAASYLSEYMSEEALEESATSIALCDNQQAFSHNYFWSIYIAASSCLNLGRREEAKAFAEKGISRFPDHLDSHYMLASVAYEINDARLFEKHFGEYVRIRDAFHSNPEKFGEIINNTIGSEWLLHLFRSMLFMDEGMEKEGQREIETARSSCPDAYLLEIRLGNYFLKKERFLDSEVHYKKAAETRPDNPWPKRFLATAYEKMNRYPEQRHMLEQAIAIESDDVSLFSLGLCLMKMGQHSEAESVFKDILKADTNNIRAVINRAICLNELEKYTDAASLLESLTCDDLNLQKAILSNRAIALFSSGRKNEAREILCSLEKIDPQDLFPPVFLSSILLDENDLQSCIIQCDKLVALLKITGNKALERVEDLAFYYLSAARKLHIIRESLRLTKECINIAFILSNNNPSLLTDIGALFMETGQTETGSEILKNALLLYSKDDGIRTKICNIINSYVSENNPATRTTPASL